MISRRTIMVDQPWASLIAKGHKTLIVGPARTDYRGPTEIMSSGNKTIEGQHALRLYGAGANPIRWNLGLMPDDDPWEKLPGFSTVAYCDQLDVVPVWRSNEDDPPDSAERYVVVDQSLDTERLFFRHSFGDYTDLTEQLPYGEYKNGHYAWLLGNIEDLQGLQRMKEEGAARYLELARKLDN